MTLLICNGSGQNFMRRPGGFGREVEREKVMAGKRRDLPASPLFLPSKNGKRPLPLFCDVGGGGVGAFRGALGVGGVPFPVGRRRFPCRRSRSSFGVGYCSAWAFVGVAAVGALPTIKQPFNCSVPLAALPFVYRGRRSVCAVCVTPHGVTLAGKIIVDNGTRKAYYSYGGGERVKELATTRTPRIKPRRRK